MTASFDAQTLAKLSKRDLQILIWRQKWLNKARPNQLPPDDDDWLEWILSAGRGFGKSLTGGQWLAYEALIDPQALPSFVIAPTLNDVRFTCFEGHTGILAGLPSEIYDYNKSNLTITFDTGAMIRGFSAEEPERLRGPQCLPAYTKITMGDGTQVPIEAVKIGDEVLTRLGPKKVTAAWSSGWKKARERLFHTHGELDATRDHRILADGDWKPAHEIETGDRLMRLTPEGPKESVVTGKLVHWGDHELYDLTVEDAHEFVAEGVVVHNCARAQLEEVGAWNMQNAKSTFDMFMMGLRLGPRPRFIATTTPRPTELMRSLLSPKPKRIIVRGSTYENRANLPDSFFDQLKQYEGTQLGRQELDGELIDEEEGAIIQRKWIRLWPSGKSLPKFDYLIQSYDTAFTDSTQDRKTGVPDPTASGTFGAFWNPETEREEILILDLWDEHLGFPDLLPRVKREMEQAYGDDDAGTPLFTPKIGPKRLRGSGRKPDLALIEDKGSGISLRQMLEREGVPLYAYNPGNADKAARLHMISHIFSQGLIWVPESTVNPGKMVTWADYPQKQDGRTSWATQLTTFKGRDSIRFDDYVDVTSQCIRVFVEKGIVTGIKRTKDDRQRDDIEEQRREYEGVRKKGNPYAQ